MPYADNDGVKIFYKTEGRGPPIVLHTGLAGTHLDWIKFADYVEALKDSYHLILIDPRGRGKSDKPYEPEMHSLKHMVGDVTSVLDEMGLEKAHFWGYSMGGRVGLAAAVYASERFNSFIIGGAGLIEKDSPEAIEEYHEYIREYEERIPFYGKDIEEVTAHIKEKRGDNMNDYTVERWMNADPRALIAFCSYYENIGMADILPTVTNPFLLYAGEEDKAPHKYAKLCNEILRNSKFISFPGLGHLEAFTRIDQVLPHILWFLENLSEP